MTFINDSIKQFLSEVEKFFYDTIKNEKLSKKAQEHKQLIVDRLTKIFEENPDLRILAQETGKGKENQDESMFTGGSTKSDNSEETAFSDYGILKIPASELKNPAFCGSLEKKQPKGSVLFGGPKLQTRWCVIHAGNFYYYVKKEDKKQAGCFKLEGYSFRKNPDITKTKKDKELAFELFNQDSARRVYKFVAHSVEDYERVKMAVHCGGFIEESDEMYEPLGDEPPPPIADDLYVEEVGVSEGQGEPQEEYEEPDKALKSPEPPAQRPPTPPPPVARGPPSKRGSALPPLPTTPAPQKLAEPAEPEPIAEDIYEDGSSVDLAAAEKSIVPNEITKDDTAPPPPPPPARGLPPQPPIPPPSESLANRRLPPTPVEPPKKKKIKLNLTCKPSEDFENQYFGKWDCKGDNPNELTFNKGDIIHVLSKEFDEKSWWVGELKGKFGLVPKTYLTPAYVVVS